VTDDEHVASLFDVGDGSFGARLDATRLVDVALSTRRDWFASRGASP
jgi:hypothetical protein